LSRFPRSAEWQCPKCGDDGFVLDEAGEAVACECRERRIRISRMEGVSSVIPRKYRGVSFDRAPLPDLRRTNPAAVQEVERFVSRIDELLEEGRGLWLIGDVGTGKTTLAMLISKAALDAGRSVAIYSVPRLLAEIRDTYDADSGERSYMDFFQRLVSVDLLHLEDLGAEKQTDWVLEQLYSLVNQRYEDTRSVLVTSNVESPIELEEQVGKRTVSRLAEICGPDPLKLFGPDMRFVDHPARSALG
jgi:DNA replication protein DnaC